VTIAPGAPTSFGVTIGSIHGFTDSVTFSVSGLPAGVTPTFTPNPATASSTLSLTTTAATPTGVYPLTITGVDGTPFVKNRGFEYAWHIDHAKKLYMRALIRHCKGNLRKIVSFWDCDSEKTVRTLIRDLGLWEELERARANEE